MDSARKNLFLHQKGEGYVCHKSSEDSGSPIPYRDTRNCLQFRSFEEGEGIKNIGTLDAYVNFRYLTESILGHAGRNSSIAQVNPKLNEELLSNLFLKHYIHYQFFVDLLGARYCDCFTFFPYNKSGKQILLLLFERLGS